MTDVATGEPRRIQFEFSGRALARLEKLKLETGATYSEVIRNAIRAYEWYAALEQGGFELARVENGQIRSVVALL